MHFNEKLSIYAELLACHGINVQKGQVVNITAEIYHRDLVQKIVSACYKRGAKFVHVDFIDPELSRLRIEQSTSLEYLKYVPSYIPIKFESFVDESAAILRLTGSEEPDSLVGLPADKINEMQNSYRASLKNYFAEGVGKSKVQWTVAAAATPKWAKKVYPELDVETAFTKLWDDIFHICRADQKDCLALWKKHNAKLHERAKMLSELKIQTLRFIGPGTDLIVGLSPKALFKAGGTTSFKGIEFEANIPTEECFTTPDYRKTSGKVRVTRPVLVNGVQVKDLEVEFTNGEISRFSASEGRDNFAAYIANDPGAKRLGEVALLGIDSPIFQTRRLFNEILFDENAACHIAVGCAYRFCLDGAASMTPEELDALGYNDSSVHTDFMISSEEVDCIATSFSGKEIPLIKKGNWV